MQVDIKSFYISTDERRGVSFAFHGRIMGCGISCRFSVEGGPRKNIKITFHEARLPEIQHAEEETKREAAETIRTVLTETFRDSPWIPEAARPALLQRLAPKKGANTDV